MKTNSEKRRTEEKKTQTIRKKPAKPVQVFLVLFGFLSLGIGIAEIFLPIVPTTPLILLAAACFLRSSDNLYQWITKHKTFGKYIHNYLHFGRVPAKSKPFSIALVWCGILLSAYFAEKTWLKILLLIIACGVSIHLALLKTTDPCEHCEDNTTSSQRGQ